MSRVTLTDLMLLLLLLLLIDISRVTVKWTLFLGLVFAGAAVRGVFGKSTVMTMAMHRSQLNSLVFSR